jgi:hypothetical protein
MFRIAAHVFVLVILAGVACAAESATQPAGETPWRRHAIETGMLGADGARLLDVDGDGRQDFVVGWEQSGVVAAYLNPGPADAAKPWPTVHFPGIRNVEDAVFVDLDGDGHIDVVSSCEGGTQTVYVHWAPADKADYLKVERWKVEAIPATAKKEMWMFALPMQVDGKHGVDLIVGSKGKGASVSWLEAPADPRKIDGWKLHRITDAGWIMSLVARDMDGDGDLDVLISDRKGKHAAVRWLENPGPGEAQTKPWTSHHIGGDGEAVLFLDTGDIDGDGLEDIVIAQQAQILALRRLDKSGLKWEPHVIPLPQRVGGGKAVTLGDIDRDGKLDLVLTCVHAGGEKSGVVWISTSAANLFSGPYQRHEISGTQGIKYDLAPLLDINGDGFPDVITTEENNNSKGGNGGLGVIWYENPGTKPAAK